MRDPIRFHSTNMDRFNASTRTDGRNKCPPLYNSTCNSDFSTTTSSSWSSPSPKPRHNFVPRPAASHPRSKGAPCDCMYVILCYRDIEWKQRGIIPDGRFYWSRGAFCELPLIHPGATPTVDRERGGLEKKATCYLFYG